MCQALQPRSVPARYSPSKLHQIQQHAAVRGVTEGQLALQSCLSVRMRVVHLVPLPL
jgi:hypothetical protein